MAAGFTSGKKPELELPPEVVAVQKVLGEPVGCDLSDRAWKSRTLLLSVSGIAAAIHFGRLHVDPSATTFGLKLSGLTDSHVSIALFSVVAYLLIHFIWCAAEAFIEWR